MGVRVILHGNPTAGHGVATANTVNVTVAESTFAVTFTVAGPVGANVLTVKLPVMVDEGTPPLPVETVQVGGVVAEKRLAVVDDITQVSSMLSNPVP